MADEHWDPDGMAKARAAERKSHGASKVLFLQSDRFEYQTGKGSAHLLWDVQGWYGGDRHKLWVKSEGEYEFDEDKIEEAEVQALWSYALSPFFDLQTGIRHNFAPGRDRTFGVIGIQGLAPYWFEIDAAAFVSGDGDISARLEAEYEILLTQRLILQPRTELNFALQDVPENEVGSGLSSAEIGARLRYEIKREFAPYIGVDWISSFGETADLIEADGSDRRRTVFVVGIRAWF